MKLRKILLHIINEQTSSKINLFENDNQILYHGSSYNFDKFTTSKIGMGSGKQSYGWGIYLTNSKETAKLYGKYIYEVTLSQGNNMTFIDFEKPVKKDIFIKIVESVYNKYNKDFNISKFKAYYDSRDRFDELKKILLDNLKKIDPDLNGIAFNEIIDIKNEKSWFYISNYTKYNKKLQSIFDEIKSLLNVDDYGFDINITGVSLYLKLSGILGGQREASLFLLKNSICGLKHSVGTEGVDYVIFDADIINIENKYQI